MRRETVEVSLSTWPCGCIADDEQVPERACWHVAYACEWCGAVFSRPDLIEWLSRDYYVHLEEHRQFLRVGERVVERVGECDDCEAPIVRDCSPNARARHLREPLSSVTPLSN